MARAASSYPVLWSESDGPPVPGQLVAGLDAVELQGGRDGRLVRRTVAYRDLVGLRVERSGARLLDGRPTLVAERRDAPALRLRPLGPGLLHEVAELLGELCAHHGCVEQAVVVLPLRPDALERARALVAEGPPFDPGDTSLERHEVYLTGSEAIFVFSGPDACESVHRIVGDGSLWLAAGEWSACLAGPPRVAEAGFTWTRDE